jgi:hypothetical protein
VLLLQLNPDSHPSRILIFHYRGVSLGCKQLLPSDRHFENSQIFIFARGWGVALDILRPNSSQGKVEISRNKPKRSYHEMCVTCVR